MRFDWRDHAIRAALLMAGAAACYGLFLGGEAAPIPFLALGGALGASLVSRAFPGGR
ncbi:MAG TPA: hypothetical protein VMS56_16085 [Thermoanaerobaculia bacterium]|nr:hypothetical protein [Thermoanaerobaculia bacterium]